MKNLHIKNFIEPHLTWMMSKNYSISSVEKRRECLIYFLRWCAERSIVSPDELELSVIEQYQKYLFHYRKKDGAPLTFGTQKSWLIQLRQFFKWLCKEKVITSNPASELELPKVGRHLPQHVPNDNEVEAVLMEPDVTTILGLRDRAILEVLYSSGIRRSELLALNLYDYDSIQETLFIREGKGRQDRILPIGARARLWLEKYLADSRPCLLGDAVCEAMFLSSKKQRLHKHTLGAAIKKYIVASGISKDGNCHMFRHAMATQMLDNGADIRYVQEMLGHRDLSTTHIYTKVSINKLKEVHEKTHPARIK